MKTVIQKNYQKQWTAQTKIDLEKETEEGRMTLTIYTDKNKSTASVSFIKGNAETTAIFQDFHKTIQQNNLSRATEKTIQESHTKAMTLLETVKEQVKEHYK